MADRPIVPIRTYVIVFVTLMILWIANMGIAYVHIGGYWNNGIAMAIGTAQFLLVFLFFMHVKYYRYPLIRYFACAGLVWVAILIALTLADYLTRNHPAGSSPRGEPVFLNAQ
ncbi:MAG TPA: cytochrome C oxidase subunit IV family protein [Tepidisphaeraceae bacterium]|jgi:caa(3)-type oxidase subunit IV|nr:cytochrome C oxidase subunit IV family protein [Tepidisphaeraceae bacterium]